MFGMKIDNDLLHRWIESHFCCLFFSIFIHFFFFSTFFVKDISTTVEDRKFIFGIQNNSNKLYRGIKNRLCPICSSVYMNVFTFLSLHAVSTVIFRNRFLSNCLR